MQRPASLRLLIGALAVLAAPACFLPYVGEGEGEEGEGEEGEGEGEGSAGEGEGEGSAGEGEGEGSAGEGEGEGSALSFCQAECAADANCPTGFVCDAQTSTCVYRPVCVDDGVGEGAECTPILSGWAYQPCTADASCYGGYGRCVDVDGDGPGSAGGCALDPASVTGPCASPWVSVSAVDLDGDAITVCGNPNGVCTNGICTTAEASSDCNENAALCLSGWVCGADGSCRCDANADCTSINAGFVCSAGRCVCDGNDDCASATTGDTCVQGTCSCTGDGECAGDQTCAPVASFDSGDVD